MVRPIKTIKYVLTVFLCLLMGLAGVGCGGSEASESGTYTLPELVIPAYSGADTSSCDVGGFDTTGADSGYVMASYTGGVPAKLQVAKDSMKYNYDIPATGEYTIFPLQMGSGTYSIRLLVSVGDNRYTAVLEEDVDAAVASEFAPFVVPNQIVDYNADSACVTFAREQAAGVSSDADVVKAVYAYIKDHVTYDVAKAQSPPAGYIPSVDDTFLTNTGICFDYASLAAAMLRSCGIPTKVETGYISPSGIYHAWNEVYVKDSGWIEVGFKIDANTWTLLDLTFAAGSSKGDLSNFIGDGNENTYETQYTY